ncbi:desert hedgehog protein A [Schistocerca cancellata]|uniref:desert hedgehog protein A n=1 Tax=Schistocerca cancellata TaxID=274614 RepID=UPI0021198160|nr:desert hedgehog protein A [Schistocerca cancellata]
MRAAWVVVVAALVVVLVPAVVLGCGPGRGGGGRGPSRKRLTPLVFKQHVPNVNEVSLAAAGKPEKRVTRNDERFRDLVPNYNADIIFKDEEGTGADRLMTQRCKERLNTLAISVMNQWPGVRLRVTEGWDEEGHHSADSLHYEGRAVDVTTSDRDRAKYGMLARLAVEAGFDWVYYESRAHIHCSVKSESSQAARSGGCFPGDATVLLSDGQRLPLRRLRVGQHVQAVDLESGQTLFSEVILFLDRSPNEERPFLRLSLASGSALLVTPAHLLPVDRGSRGVQQVFAGSVRPGDNLFVSGENVTSVHVERVLAVSEERQPGVYAPLTRHGTVVVDGVAASCYAVVSSHSLAHWSYAPYRFGSGVRDLFRKLFSTGPEGGGPEAAGSERATPSSGVHWYARALYAIARFVLPSGMLYK